MAVPAPAHGPRRGPRLPAPRALVACALALLAAIALASCTRETPPATPPSLLLISIDTLRADHLGAYRYDRPTSPSIDALAAGGALFERAYAPSSWTLPSHASMLSGASPYRHGAVTQRHAIRAEVPMLAERLRDHGYATAGIISAPFLGRRFGFARGFDVFEQHAKRARDRDKAAFHARVLELVGELPRAPFFLFVHYFDVHGPYDPAPAFDRFRAAARSEGDGNVDKVAALVEKGEVEAARAERDRLVDLYDGEILEMDAKISELLAAVRERTKGNVVAILTSDHGEEFFEHGGLRHGRTLYDEVLHVPLVVAGTGVSSGLRVDDQVSLLDVAPTLLELAGAPPIAESEGRSLAALLRAGAPPDPAASSPLALLTLAHDGSVALRGVRTPAEKLIVDERGPRRELYDLRADPAESTNRYPQAGGAPLEAMISARAIETAPVIPPPKGGLKKRLESLGYL
jgi:arylsulfatase A-like enzyme